MTVRIYNRWEINMLYDMSSYCLNLLRDNYGLQAYRIKGSKSRILYYIAEEVEELIKKLDKEDIAPKEKAINWDESPLTYDEWKAERRNTLKNALIEQEQNYKIFNKK